jgi:hypothetical protein
MHLLSRKFLLSLVGILAGAGLAYLGKLDTATAGLIGTIVAAYLGSNVTQKAVV